MFTTENIKLILARPFYSVFEGEPGSGEGEGGGEGGGSGEGEGEVKFTPEQQAHMNKILAAEKKKHQQNQQAALDEINGLKTRSNLTASETSELNGRIEELQKKLMTTEELAKADANKRERQYKKTIEELTTRAEGAEKKYVNSTISRSITDAAAENQAFSPDQLVAILRPSTRLAEVLNDDGKATGEQVVKTKLNTVNDKGESIELDLTVKEAVKRMTEMESFANLFRGSGVGGTGASGGSKGKASSLADLALKDPAEYRKARKAGKNK